jgi:hypothetical protein
VVKVEMPVDVLDESQWKLQDISGFAAAVRASDSVTVFEGLPYPEAEEKWYKRESKRKDLIWIHGFPFYPHLLKVSDDDFAQIKEILLAPAAHLEFPKVMPSLLCEDFHPNYAVVWSKGREQVGTLIDLNCRAEWRNFTPVQLFEGRIAHEAWTKLSKVLVKYRQEYPERMSYFIPNRPPSDQMRALVRAINERGILSNLTQLERVPVREVKSIKGTEEESVSPSGVIFWDTLSPEAMRTADPEKLFKTMPWDERMVVRKLDGSQYWIIRDTGDGDSEAFVGPDLSGTMSK